MIILTVDRERKKLIVVVNTFDEYARLGIRGYENSLFVAVDGYKKANLEVDTYEHETDDDDYYEEEFLLLKLPYKFTGEIDIREDHIGWFISAAKECDSTRVQFVDDYKRRVLQCQ